MVKFSQKTPKIDFINLVILLILSILIVIFSNSIIKYFALTLFASYLVFILFKNGNVLIPRKQFISINQIYNSIERCLSDYMLIFAPFIINFYVKKYYMDTQYIVFQLCVTSLSFSSLLSSVIERAAFDKHLQNKKYNFITPEKSMFFMVVISVISVLILALFLKVPLQYFLFLALNASVSPLFSYFYNHSRFNLKISELKLVGLILIINIFINIIINYYFFNNSLNFLLFSMAFIAFVNILFLKRKIRNIQINV
jgi:hypothetical protein